MSGVDKGLNNGCNIEFMVVDELQALKHGPIIFIIPYQLYHYYLKKKNV